MHAVILAGGKGTRLKPYTFAFPKPLVPLGDTPIMDVVVRQLARAGFGTLTVSTGHLAELIQAYFGDGSKWGVTIEYVLEDEPLSTAGALRLVQPRDEHLLVLNGDLLTDMDLAAFLDGHRAAGADATVATTIRSENVDFGVVESEDGRLVAWREKPVYEFEVSMGIYALNADVIGLIGDGEALGMPDLLGRIVERGGRVDCARSACYWLDIGRVGDYEQAQEEFEANRERFLPAEG